MKRLPNLRKKNRKLSANWLFLLSLTVSLIVLLFTRIVFHPFYKNVGRSEYILTPTTLPALIEPVVIPTSIESYATKSAIPELELTSPPKHNSISLPLIVNHAVLNTYCSLGEEDSTLNSSINSTVNETRLATLNGSLVKWYPLALSFRGPFATEKDHLPNPFLDYRLQVIFVGPSGQIYSVPGFFAGDGNSFGKGNIWQAIFVPDEPGLWRYCASFRSGKQIAIELDTNIGTPLSFDGVSGNFEVKDLNPNAPGFLKWGRLEYVHANYLRFHDGPYWIKGGTNSPENFLGYKGFDNTIDQGGVIEEYLHEYSSHVKDWLPEDPNFVSEDSNYDARGIIGALNYLSSKRVNSIYFLTMNLGGDGQETYPFLSASGSHFDNTHYDISKLFQWNIVFNHAQRLGIALHMVLNETEVSNREWLDDGLLDIERKLFYREMIARFGYILALKWNLSEENVFSVERLYEFANYIQALDWANHPISVHTPSNYFREYEQLLGDKRFTATSIQYGADSAGYYVETWRKASTLAGQPWVIDMDENNPAGIGLTPWNTDELRKRVLYDVYFSGGNIEWYAGYHDLPVGGDMSLEDFRTREAMWDYMWYARQFMGDHLPFWDMVPVDHVLSGESELFGGGEVIAIEGLIYAIYLPDASPSGSLLINDAETDYILQWFNPRTGFFEGESIKKTVQDNEIGLGGPPKESDSDWVVLVKAVNLPELEALRSTPYP